MFLLCLICTTELLPFNHVCSCVLQKHKRPSGACVEPYSFLFITDTKSKTKVETAEVSSFTSKAQRGATTSTSFAHPNKKIDTIKEFKRVRKAESRRVKRIEIRYTDKVKVQLGYITTRITRVKKAYNMGGKLELSAHCQFISKYKVVEILYQD